MRIKMLIRLGQKAVCIWGLFLDGLLPLSTLLCPAPGPERLTCKGCINWPSYCLTSSLMVQWEPKEVSLEGGRLGRVFLYLSLCRVASGKSQLQ